MSLLLNSKIEEKVKRHIVGKIARVGGSVNQLLTYKNCVVEDINLVDGGYGIVRSMDGVRSPLQMLKVIQRYLSQERKFLLRGYAVPRDRKTISLDMHNAYEIPSLARRYDAIISSNMIEHSPNPILLLLNFYFVTREGGYQYHAIPHYKYTFDVHRVPTPLEHMIQDFEHKTNRSDTSHNEDYVQSAIEKHGWQRSFHEKYPVAYPYMHFHVFDEHNIKQLFELMFEDVVTDVLKTQEFSDNVVLFRNTLNKDFVGKYRALIESYSKNILSGTV
jgi:hypothetical protein